MSDGPWKVNPTTCYTRRAFALLNASLLWCLCIALGHAASVAEPAAVVTSTAGAGAVIIVVSTTSSQSEGSCRSWPG